ncbi:MAG: hypothetical protein U0871_04550 [Gemmataceae bacterium]
MKGTTDDGLAGRAAWLMQRMADHECPGLDELERVQWETGRMKAVQELALAGGLTHAGRVRAGQMVVECERWMATMIADGLADEQLDRLDGAEIADASDLRLVAQETGWVMAVKHLAKHRGLTRAGQVEAGKLLAASREWAADLAGEEPGRGR